MEGVKLSKIRQTEKGKYCIISLICGIKKIQQTSDIAKEKQTHRYREQTCLPLGGRGGRGKKKKGEITTIY